jgi:ribosomal protein S21
MTTQKEYIDKLKKELEEKLQDKQNKLKEKIEMPRPKNKNYSQHRRSKRYTADDWGFSPAEVVVQGDVIRAYKKLQRLLEKDGTLRIARERRRFNPDKHKNQKR